MDVFMEEFQHLKIQLDEIKSATNNFDKTKVIGGGGFGKVYEGKLKGQTMVAFKCLNPLLGQGNSEFWKEIMTLSRYKHENLISLVGFCDERGEKILAYEHAARGSLDRHLSSTTLTWMQRLKISLQAARGLSYLHDPRSTQQRILHRDIKSSNILIDEYWNAKISDMGLSKFGPANQQHTAVISSAVGTLGYLDPLYMEVGLLTKESDVYSFGVVLFEVLCGRLCYEYKNGQYTHILVRNWIRNYEEKKIDDIIFKDLRQQMDSTSLETYLHIARQCLQRLREDRPTMSQVVEKLEIAIEYQEVYERVGLPKDYKELIKNAVTPLNYKSESELKMLLIKGILINGGKTWYWLNKKGEHCELIYIAERLTPIPSDSSQHNSRFDRYKTFTYKTQVRAQFLTPHIAYNVNLLLKHEEQYIGLEYKLEGETDYSYAFLSDEREDEWLTLELYQFTSRESTLDLEIVFHIKYCQNIVMEGIEFQPQEKVEHEVLKEEVVDMQGSETYWKEKLPSDFEAVIKLSKDRVQFNTYKELYFILREGFLINNGGEWFSLAKDRKKRLMVQAKAVLEVNRWKWKSIPRTRFEVAHNPPREFGIFCEIKSIMLSSETTYAAYLVYKQDRNYNVQPAPAQVKNKNNSDSDSDSEDEPCYIYLRTPQTPVIKTDYGERNTHNPSHKPKIKGLPQKRSDGWMEVQIWEFQNDTRTEKNHMDVEVSSYDKPFKGLEVYAIEFRPI